jgi:hypothetical protein
MCDVNYPADRSSTRQRPRWSALYLLAGLLLGLLLALQAFVAASTERTALQSGLVLLGFAAMVQWARRNRAALDHLDWCDCASERVTIRVIASRRGAPALARDNRDLPWVDPDSVETLEEIAR